ncbi:MAG: radical SAM protein [bacterium]
MKIAFIAPSVKFVSEYAPLNDLLSAEISRGYRWPEFNLTLLTLAGLTPRDFEIHIIDEIYKTIDFEEKYDIVALTSMTFNVFRAYEIAKKFREKGSYVVLGGIHATLLPQEAAQHVDTVFVGEAEATWPQFIQEFKKGTHKKMYYGSQPELELSPIPRWDFMGDFITKESLDRFKTINSWTIGLNATRGCPRDCEYCSSTRIFGSKFRRKSVKQVVHEVREIKKWTKAFGVDNYTIAFRDDNPILGVKYGSDLVDALTEEKVLWTALTDIAIYKHPELIQKLFPSGCLALGLGFESLSQESLESIAPWKSTQIKHYADFVEFAVNEGFLISLNFIFGMDSDTAETVKLVDDFCSRYPIAPNFLLLTPFPNQPITRRLRNEGRLPEEIYWNRCNLYNLVFEPKQMSKEELYSHVSYLHRKFNSPEHWAAIRSEIQSIRNRRGRLAPHIPAVQQGYKPRANQSFTA